MKILYLTYDGLTDPLGQSQVLPYLSGLSDNEHEITVISFEKKNRLKKFYPLIQKQLKEKKIEWIILTYTKKPVILSTLFDIVRLKLQCIALHKKNKFQIVHCRSYISAFAGLMMKNKFGIKFFFDMRGFFADERVDGGLWNLNKMIYRKVYSYFKKKETIFLNASDKIVTLTDAAKNILISKFSVSEKKIEVIPCCVDMDLFSPEKITALKKAAWREKLGIGQTDFLINYLGSLGTWYLLDEMLDFFSQLTAKHAEAKFLFITHHSAGEILNNAVKKNIPKEKIIVVPASRSEVPELLSLCSISIFFIKPSFSKIASSPTKQAESLSMEVPIICNSGVGDVDEIVASSGTGFVINGFNNSEYQKAVNSIPFLMSKNKIEIRKYALDRFSLVKGVSLYRKIYTELGRY